MSFVVRSFSSQNSSIRCWFDPQSRALVLLKLISWNHKSIAMVHSSVPTFLLIQYVNAVYLIVRRPLSGNVNVKLFVCLSKYAPRHEDAWESGCCAAASFLTWALDRGEWSASRPGSFTVRLGVSHPSGTRDQFFFLLTIFYRQLRVCHFVPPSLTRGRVCDFLLLLVLASAVPLGSESWRNSRPYFIVPQFLRLPQPGGPGPRIYIPQE
jgi:hypothetical protein